MMPGLPRVTFFSLGLQIIVPHFTQENVLEVFSSWKHSCCFSVYRCRWIFFPRCPKGSTSHNPRLPPTPQGTYPFPNLFDAELPWRCDRWETYPLLVTLSSVPDEHPAVPVTFPALLFRPQAVCGGEPHTALDSCHFPHTAALEQSTTHISPQPPPALTLPSRCNWEVFLRFVLFFTKMHFDS